MCVCVRVCVRMCVCVCLLTTCKLTFSVGYLYFQHKWLFIYFSSDGYALLIYEQGQVSTPERPL